jgi:F-type H+-transporting ATPase subunit epsilon
MANTIHVDIVSPEGQLYAGEANMVFAPAAEGEIGIAPRHAPLLTTLTPGTVRVQIQGEEEHTFWIGGGALEIQPHVVSILADTAARAKDLDEARAQAEAAVRDSKDSVDLARAQAELAQAIAQLRTIAQLRKKR